MKELHQQFPLFSQLSEKEFNKFVSTLSERRYKAGEHIVRQGEKGPNAYFLIQGRAEVFSTSDKGREAHILFYAAPALFGIIEIWNELPYLGTVAALEPSTTLIMDKSQYLSLLHRSHQACLTIIQFLSEQVYQGGVDQRVRRFGDTQHIISRFLINQAESSGEKIHDGFFLPSAINKSQIAKSLGFSRRHIIECFKILEESKLIEIQKGNMFIPSLEKLKIFANSVWNVHERRQSRR